MRKIDNGSVWVILIILFVVGLTVLFAYQNFSISGKAATQQPGKAMDVRPACKDSDGGIRPNVKGNCSDSNGVFNDHCKGSLVGEYYCSKEDGLCHAVIVGNQSPFHCVKCLDGRCVSGPATQPQFKYDIVQEGRGQFPWGDSIEDVTTDLYVYSYLEPPGRKSQFNLKYATFSIQRGFDPFCLNLNTLVELVDIRNKNAEFSMGSYDMEFPIMDGFNLSIGQVYNKNGLYLKVLNISEERTNSTEEKKDVVRVNIKYSPSTFPYDSLGPC